MISTSLSYKERAACAAHPLAKELFLLAEEKQSNLALSADVTRSEEFLKLIDAVGPEICVLKTHIDILEDFSFALIEQLRALAARHRFLIFEDRKFADIGNTVLHQYGKGIYRIAEWAEIINAHIIPGPGVIEGLKQIGLPKGRGLLLIAEMSSQGTLATGKYTERAVELAAEHPDFVIGFIATTRRLTQDPRFLHFTPGVQVASSQDSLGQQYQTPSQAVKQGSDILIVGRGIYGAKDPKSAAALYRREGWEAYVRRLSS